MRNTTISQNIFSLMLTVCMLSACGTESDDALYENGEMLDDVQMESEYALKAKRAKCYKKVLAELASGKSRSIINRLGREIHLDRPYSLRTYVRIYKAPTRKICNEIDIDIEGLLDASLELFKYCTEKSDVYDAKNATKAHLKDIKKSFPKPKLFSAYSFEKSFLDDDGEYKSVIHQAIYNVMAF